MSNKGFGLKKVRKISMQNKPLLALQNNPFSLVLTMVLDYHLKEGSKVLDPTCGLKYSWAKYLDDSKKANIMFYKPRQFEITFVDKKEGGGLEGLVYEDFDAVYFDPPFVFGLKNSSDERQEDYGGYDFTFEGLKELFVLANEVFVGILKEKGLLFLKYTDVFSFTEKKYYYCASIWPNIFSHFEVIDHYIVQHHNINPTAYQVKDRGLWYSKLYIPYSIEESMKQVYCI